MKKRKMEEAVQRVMERVLDENPYGNFYEALLNLEIRSNKVNFVPGMDASKVDKKIEEEIEKESKKIDISEIATNNCSIAEVQQIKSSIIIELKKELVKERSYFMTMKIVLAFWALSPELKEVEMNNPKIQFCCEEIELYESTLCNEYDEVLKHISLLD